MMTSFPGQVRKMLEEGTRGSVVLILPDAAEHYFTTAYSDTWVRKTSIPSHPSHPIHPIHSTYPRSNPSTYCFALGWIYYFMESHPHSSHSHSSRLIHMDGCLFLKLLPTFSHPNSSILIPITLIHTHPHVAN